MLTPKKSNLLSGRVNQWTLLVTHAVLQSLNKKHNNKEFDEITVFKSVNQFISIIIRVNYFFLSNLHSFLIPKFAQLSPNKISSSRHSLCPSKAQQKFSYKNLLKNNNPYLAISRITQPKLISTKTTHIRPHQPKKSNLDFTLFGHLHNKQPKSNSQQTK